MTELKALAVEFSLCFRVNPTLENELSSVLRSPEHLGLFVQ